MPSVIRIFNGKEYVPLEYLKAQMAELKPIDKPEKQTYTLLVRSDVTGYCPISQTLIDFSVAGVEALAEAIKALVKYTQDTPEDATKPFFPKYLVDACEKARELISSEEQV